MESSVSSIKVPYYVHHSCMTTQCEKHCISKYLVLKHYLTEIFRKYPDAVGANMEEEGVYGAPALDDVAWIVVKGIADWGDGTTYDEWQAWAASVASLCVKKALSHPSALTPPVAKIC